MKRKVIQIADSTQLISLPRKWCVEHEVKKGDELDIEEQGNKIIINLGQGEHKAERRELDSTRMGLFLMRAIVAYYKTGIDEIEIRVDDPSLLESIALLIREDLPGFELLEQSNRFCLIKCIATERETDFDPALRRIFLITNSMGKNVVDFIKNPEPKLINSILAMEKTCNRFCNFCERLINKHGYKDAHKSVFMYSLIWSLEKISDEYKYLCQYLAKTKNNEISKDALTIFAHAVELANLMQSLFYKFDTQQVATMAELRKKIVQEGTHIMDTRKGADSQAAHYAINITQQSFNVLGLIFALHS